MYTNPPYKYIKTERENSNIKKKSEIQSKFENMEVRGSRLRYLMYTSMTVLFLEDKKAKGASYVKLPIKN